VFNHKWTFLVTASSFTVNSSPDQTLQAVPCVGWA
jgi:hypothetical protein